MAVQPIDLDNDGWLKGAIASLWFCGACYLVIGLACPAFLLLAGMSGGSDEEVQAIITGVCMFPVGIACAIGNFAVAVALRKRKKWAWVGGLIAGGLYISSACLPFGAILLYALLRSGVKEAYEAEAAARA